MNLKVRLNDIHARVLAGSRSATLDLFREALGPIKVFLRRKFRSLPDEQAYDLATDAIVAYSTDPARFDPGKSSLWSYLCRIAMRDASDLLRRREVEAAFIKGVEDDVEFWTSRAKDTFRGEDAIDARQIMKLHGGRLVTNETEAKVLMLILHEEKRTDAFAEALGLAPGTPDTKEIVKQAKDRMLLRLKRLRDEL